MNNWKTGLSRGNPPTSATVGFPHNFASGKAYRGVNVFLLGSLNYTSPWFLTYIQAKELGGNVKKGERGALVVKYGTYKKEDETPVPPDEPEEVRKFLKGYTVFNASQIEGIDFPKVEVPDSRQHKYATAHAKSWPGCRIRLHFPKGLQFPATVPAAIAS
ncbi:MAG: ArdC family protein [Chthoniobacteraceae bacterium]